MYRLETSTTSANAAWQYLLENGVSFDSPVKQIASRALQKANLKRPLSKEEIKTVNRFKNVRKKDIENFVSEKMILLKKKFASLKKKFSTR
jgi:argininosuccinate lyase